MSVYGLTEYDAGRILGRPMQVTIDTYKGEDKAYAKAVWETPAGTAIRLRAPCREGVDYWEKVIKPLKREMLRQIALKALVPAGDLTIQGRPVQVTTGPTPDFSGSFIRFSFRDPDQGNFDAVRTFRLNEQKGHPEMVEGFMALVDKLEEVGVTTFYDGVFS